MPLIFQVRHPFAIQLFQRNSMGSPDLQRVPFELEPK